MFNDSSEDESYTPKLDEEPLHGDLFLPENAPPKRAQEIQYPALTDFSVAPQSESVSHPHQQSFNC